MSVGGGGFSESSSSPTVVSPFGSLPYLSASRENRGFSGPLAGAFGYGGGKFGKEAGYGKPGSGPLATTYIPQMTSAVGGYVPQMQALSSQITGGANSAFGSYQSQVDSFLQQLPGFQSQMGAATSGSADALNYAKTAAEDVFNPLSSSALFGKQAQDMLSAARPGEAARGLADTGSAQAAEQSMIANLAGQSLQNQQANRQAAVQGITGAAGNLANVTGAGAQVAQMGPQAASALFSAYPQLASILQGAAQMPMDAANNLLGFLQGTQNPAMSLLKMILPQVAQKSSSFGLQLPTA